MRPMDEATTQHLANIKTKRDKLQAEIDRIEGEWEDPLKVQAERASRDMDERLRVYRLKHCRCTACNRQFDTERGLGQHERSCMPWRRYIAARNKWMEDRQGPPPQPNYPEAM